MFGQHILHFEIPVYPSSHTTYAEVRHGEFVLSIRTYKLHEQYTLGSSVDTGFNNTYTHLGNIERKS
jgi:hypothetical protein